VSVFELPGRCVLTHGQEYGGGVREQLNGNGDQINWEIVERTRGTFNFCSFGLQHFCSQGDRQISTVMGTLESVDL
jgi:hypothetical protein